MVGLSAKLIAGVDEAGRGAVIGPLVICVAAIDKGKENSLRGLGVKDSKMLGKERRSVLYEQILKICRVRVIKISAKELNLLMEKHTLNEIEAMACAPAIASFNPDIAYVDSPDPQPKKFELRLKKFGVSCNLVCENGADAKYPIVSAASIVAKVERDAEIDQIKKILGFDFNSGYPSDEKTCKFLENKKIEGKLLDYVRLKWRTLKKIRQKKISDFFS